MIARYPAHIPVALFAVWTGLARAGGPPCPSGRPVAVCAEFVNPYSYNAVQWAASCQLTETIYGDVLVAYNAVTTLNASEPGW